MASFSVMKKFEIHRNEELLKKAEENKRPVIIREMKPEKIEKKNLGKGDTISFDFGEHMVGFLSMQLNYTGSHPDAPAYLKLKFGEMKKELSESSEDYDGWISRSWIQEEYIHVDVLPQRLRLPRRYAFRYLEVEVIDVSPKFSLVIEDISCEAVSAVAYDAMERLRLDDELLNEIDWISQVTLRECMQDVFEDGPKRDRRLWLGDFRLQAKTNYVTFKNYELVRRCLYLFGGMPFNEGKISACLFTEPVPEPDDTYLMDYALFFVPTLWDYFEAAADQEVLTDLYDIAMKQITICLEMLDEQHLVQDQGDAFWCFLDWGDGLNKQAGAQAVLIYCMRYGMKLAKAMGDKETEQQLRDEIEACKSAAMDRLWDSEKKMFISGSDRQISWASQVWMVLAQVLSDTENKALLARCLERRMDVSMVTPYMYHHYVEALLQCGETEMAFMKMKEYWGEMVKDGADTFWELYNPENKEESPYGSSIVNSYCHAWSCTPAYLIRTCYGGKRTCMK